MKAMDCCVQSLLEADACASLHGLVQKWAIVLACRPHRGHGS